MKPELASCGHDGTIIRVCKTCLLSHESDLRDFHLLWKVSLQNHVQIVDEENIGLRKLVEQQKLEMGRLRHRLRKLSGIDGDLA